MTTNNQPHAEPQPPYVITAKLGKAITDTAAMAAMVGNQEIYAVIVPPDQVPTCEKFANRDALAARILQLRSMQQSVKLQDPTADYHLFVFHGHRWKLQKGEAWFIHDGQALTAVRAQVSQLEGIDESGSLDEDLPLPQMLAAADSQSPADVQPTRSAVADDSALPEIDPDL